MLTNAIIVFCKYWHIKCSDRESLSEWVSEREGGREPKTHWERIVLTHADIIRRRKESRTNPLMQPNLSMIIFKMLER